MNWFKRLFVHRADRDSNGCITTTAVEDWRVRPRDTRDEVFESVAHMTFSIVRAHGGIIVRVQKYGYEQRQARSSNDDQPVIHVIPDTEDFQTSLNKIIVLETLRA
jgi:hypothetical protein